MTRPAGRGRPWGIAVVLAVTAIRALAPITAMGYDKVERQPPQVAGTALGYYIREANSQDAPQAGRPVTMRVQSAPGGGARVAAADAGHHQVGPQGLQASTRSGADGLAYFALQLSPVAGENDFVWDDGAFSGEVVVVGTAPPAGVHGAVPPPARAAAPPGSPGVGRVVVAALVATAITVVVGGVVFLSGALPFRTS
jgi:hypothetical protein